MNPYFKLYAKLAIGRIRYSNNVKFLDSSIKYTGNTYGINSTLGLEYRINNHFGFNIDFSLLQIPSTKINSSTNDEKENLSRYDVNVGLIVYL